MDCMRQMDNWRRWKPNVAFMFAQWLHLAMGTHRMSNLMAGRGEGLRNLTGMTVVANPFVFVQRRMSEHLFLRWVTAPRQTAAQNARQRLAEPVAPANPLPHTCLRFLCEAWIAESSWRCRCWSLITHGCHLVLILYLNSFWTTMLFFFLSNTYF